jgi:ribosomal protein S18 acetylase RimI-like enzyme
MEIRRMQENDFDEVVAVLMAAFMDTLFYRYIVPDETERRAFHLASFRERIAHGLEVNHIDVAMKSTSTSKSGENKITGVAMWAPPEASFPSAENAPPAFTADLLAAKKISPGVAERFLAFLHLMHDANKRLFTPPFWSLAPVAVLPEEQGKGIGSALMRKKLAEIDASHLPCILATQDRINLPIYEHYGFHTVYEESIVSPDIVHYTMYRPGLD